MERASETTKPRKVQLKLSNGEIIHTEGQGVAIEGDRSHDTSQPIALERRARIIRALIEALVVSGAIGLAIVGGLKIGGGEIKDGTEKGDRTDSGNLENFLDTQEEALETGATRVGQLSEKYAASFKMIATGCKSAKDDTELLSCIGAYPAELDEMGRINEELWELRIRREQKLGFLDTPRLGIEELRTAITRKEERIYGIHGDHLSSEKMNEQSRHKLELQKKLVAELISQRFLSTKEPIGSSTQNERDIEIARLIRQISSSQQDIIQAGHEGDPWDDSEYEWNNFGIGH